MDNRVRQLLPKVKAHIVLQHDEDDEMLCGFIRAAIDYAQNYQKVKYGRKKLSPATEQAVIMLSGHFYESRDGATGGFFSDHIASVPNVWQTINRLLALEKRWDM